MARWSGCGLLSSKGASIAGAGIAPAAAQYSGTDGAGAGDARFGGGVLLRMDVGGGARTRVVRYRAAKWNAGRGAERWRWTLSGGHTHGQSLQFAASGGQLDGRHRAGHGRHPEQRGQRVHAGLCAADAHHPGARVQRAERPGGRRGGRSGGKRAQPVRRRIGARAERAAGHGIAGRGQPERIAGRPERLRHQRHPRGTERTGGGLLGVEHDAIQRNDAESGDLGRAAGDAGVQ